MQDITPAQLLKLCAVQARTTLDRASIRRLVARGEFPPPCRLSPGRVAWESTKVDAWIASRIRAEPALSATAEVK